MLYLLTFWLGVTFGAGALLFFQACKIDDLSSGSSPEEGPPSQVP